MDCGRTPSARARAVTVEGPSRSSRPKTDCWDKVRSPARTHRAGAVQLTEENAKFSGQNHYVCCFGSVCWVLTLGTLAVMKENYKG